MVEFKVIKPPKGAIEKQIIDALKKDISKKIGNVKCSEHHQGPVVKISGSSKKPMIEIEGCCEKFIKSVTEVYNS